MKCFSRTANCLWMLGAFVGILLASSLVTAQITLATKGQPVIATGAGTATSDGLFWDASRFTGAPVNDICGKINAAWTAALGTGVVSATIDARGITGAQTCANSPFPSNATGKLLLGNTVITTSVTWQILSHVEVDGLGISGLTAGTTDNTTIKAGASLISTVIQLGNGSGLSFGAKVKGLTVDAAGIASAGILNESAEEGSTVEDVNIWNATTYGLHVIVDQSGTNGGQNSGPYHNINIQYNSNCPSACNSSVPILVEDPSATPDSGKVVRAFDSITVSAGGLPVEGTIGIHINGVSTHITNCHVEYFSTGIEIGDTIATHSVEIENVSSGITNHGWDVDIGSLAGDITIIGLTHQLLNANLLNDHVTGNQITSASSTGAFLGLYVLGEGTNPAVISTAATVSGGTNLKWVAPGDLQTVGHLSKGSGTFKIDDPLDPANKYLYHSFVESPDMMNVYNGSVTTDKRGMATVTLPDYFEALNRDFRYQLTAIGTLAQATVAKKIEGNRFVIQTSKPRVEVSWQVTGIRQDAYANAHRVQVEEQKSLREQGHYLHPELFEKGEKQVAQQAAGK